MKKIFVLCAFAVLSLSLSAQLAWDTEFKQADFNNAQTVISKTENVSWNNGVFGLGAHLEIGKIVIIGNAYNDECVIALPQIGIAQKLYFAWQGASNGTITVYQSPDHNNWQQVFSTEGNTIASNKADSAVLSTSTRYIKFAATGRTAAAFSNIRVSEGSTSLPIRFSMPAIMCSRCVSPRITTRSIMMRPCRWRCMSTKLCRPSFGRTRNPNSLSVLRCLLPQRSLPALRLRTLIRLVCSR